MLLAGLTPELLWAAGWIFLLGAFVVSRHLPFRWALLIAGAKMAVSVLYFAADASGTLHFGDDLDYFHRSVALVRMGYNPVTIFTDPNGLLVLGQMTSSRHVAYNMWNLFAMWLFGPHYFAPVLLNVGLTFVAGWFFHRILQTLGFPRHYAGWALAFFLLHWDTVIWSSFLNLKDVLVMTLTLSALHHVLLLMRRPALLPALALLLSFGILLFLRFYIPVVLLAAVAAFLLWNERGVRRLGYLLVFAGGLGALVVWNLPGLLNTLRLVQPGEIFWGVPHFLLTPLPWNLDPSYEVLYYPSWLWLGLAAPAACAAVFLWGRHPHAKLLFMYLALLVLLYAVVPDLRGPRHRVQVSFLFIWMQFHALWVFARYLAGPPRARAPSRPDVSAVGRAGP